MLNTPTHILFSEGITAHSKHELHSRTGTSLRRCCKSEAKAYYLALLKHFRTNRINYRYTVSNNSFLKSVKSNHLLQLQGVHDWTKSANYARELIISLSHASLHVQVTCARQQLCTERVIENAYSQTTSDLHDTAGEQ